MTRRDYLLIFFVSFLFDVTFFLLYIAWFGPESFWGADSSQYKTLAHNLLAGNGFSLHQEAPFPSDVFRTPGYPLFLAGLLYLFGTLWSVMLVQTIINSAVPVMAAYIGYKISNSRAIAFIAAALTLLEPYMALWQMSVATEGIFIFLITLFVVCMLRFRDNPNLLNALTSGAMLGAATLVRPSHEFFIPLAFIFILWWCAPRDPKKVAAVAACFLLGVGAFLMPWIYRNYATTGHAILSTQGPLNLYDRTAVTVYAAATDQIFQPVWEKFIRDLYEEGIIPRNDETELYNPDISDILVERSIDVFKAYPKEFIMLQPIYLHSIFTQDSTLGTLNHMDLLPYPVRPPVTLTLALAQGNPFNAIVEFFPYMRGMFLWALAARIFWHFVLLAAIVGFVYLWRHKKPERSIVAFAAVFVLYSAVAILPVAASIDPRLRTPFQPVYFAFAAAGGLALWVWLKKRFHR